MPLRWSPALKTLARPIEDIARALAAGETTSRALVEAALASIAAEPSAFVAVNAQAALAQADAADRHRSGPGRTVFAGVPVSVKDLFDVAGEVTRAGATALGDAAPAQLDAPVVARLRSAGAIIIGRTQMSEFAFTGLGLNPHVPQPLNPAAPGRVTGGSSGGAAASVALGQAVMGLGTDTGGSVRIPAAFCGLAGFKPTQRRISRQGAFPLSATLDSIGPIARTLACCRLADEVLADEPTPPSPARSVSGLRLGVPQGLLLEAMDPAVAKAFDRALAALSAAGAVVEDVAFPELSDISAMNARGTISNAEAFAFHRRLGLLSRRDAYDPNVLVRVELGASMSAADYLDLLAARQRLIEASNRVFENHDALIAPTVPILPPLLSELTDPADFARLNGLTLRNPSVVNLLDGCAASVPMALDPAPCGLMVMGAAMSDATILRIAEALEPVVTP